jgi:hypothetical protein
MTADDWAVPAKLIERDDSGSELAYDFHERAQGTLAEMVARVAAMAGPERARMLIDAGALGMLNVGQILEMAGRDDFPG